MTYTAADIESFADEYVSALVYTVTAEPYGESLYREFATADEALEFANGIAALTGTYQSSHGEQPVHTVATITEHVPTAANPIAAAVVTADRILATKGVRVPRRGYTLTNELTGQVFSDLTENEAHDIIWPTPAPYRFCLVSPRGAGSIYIK